MDRIAKRYASMDLNCGRKKFDSKLSAHITVTGWPYGPDLTRVPEHCFLQSLPTPPPIAHDSQLVERPVCLFSANVLAVPDMADECESHTTRPTPKLSSNGKLATKAISTSTVPVSKLTGATGTLMQKRTEVILGHVQNKHSNSVFVNGIGAHTPPHKRRKNSVSSTDNGEDSKHVSTSIESVSKLTVLSSNARKRPRGDVFNVSDVPIRRSARIASRPFVSDLGVSTDPPSMAVINNGSLTLNC